MPALEPQESRARTDIILLRGPEGAMSLELAPVREGVARAFLKQSPRSLTLSDDNVRKLEDTLRATGYKRILAADNRKKLLQRTLLPLGWRAARSVLPSLDNKCSICATHDLPLDENLIDDKGQALDLTDTDSMVGVSMDLGSRQAWGFYTDDGDTARVVSEGNRRQGMLVALSDEDMTDATGCFLRFLAASKKKWALFSVHMGRFVRQYDPVTLYRMELERPKGYDHSIRPYGKEYRKILARLFSEYYDERPLQASMRVRRLSNDRNYSMFVTESGFVIVRLEGEAGLIYDIYVTPSLQGEGIGGELMRCALTSLSGRVSSVYLHTSYPRAKSMYEKFGFKTVYSQLALRLDELAFEPPSS